MVVDTCLFESVLVLLNGKSLIIGDSSGLLALADLDLDDIALSDHLALLDALFEDHVIIVIVVVLKIRVKNEEILPLILGVGIELTYEIRHFSILVLVGVLIGVFSVT